ncbi:MAG: transporter [Thermodesulfovibrionales bacterium]|nr:transporter [Thermodesulfovibrionales bacterium]
MFKKIVIFAVVLFPLILYFNENSYALHPLITEDTGVQGKGNTELEFGMEYARESEDGQKQTTSSAALTMAYGLTDAIDLIVGIPYQRLRTKTDETTTENGISDMIVELKWKFYENNGLSLALKPGISIPSGDKDKGLGNGKAAYGIYFITTKEIEPVTLHFNAMYKRNENSIEQRKDLWHLSLAAEVKVADGWRIVGNIGMDRNTDKESGKNPSFALGGLVYSPTKDIDIDLGYRQGLNKPATDYSILAGITWRF